MMTLYQENGLILVIHPQPELGVWLEKILSDFGHSVTITHDITQGLAIFEQERHHLMIVDLALMQEHRLIEFAKKSPEIRIPFNAP
jgi:DNA-binding response OmpR family regulator